MVLVSILCVMSVFGMAAQNDSIMTRAVSNNSTYYGVQGNIGINSISASNLTQHNKPDFGGDFTSPTCVEVCSWKPESTGLRASLI